MAIILEVKNVTYTYPGEKEPAIKNVSLAVSEGEITCIKGPNGSGKTTLLLVMAGLLRPEKGAVYYRGSPLIDQLPHMRSKFGILFQNPEVMMINPTVYDEIAYGPRQLYNEDTVKRKVTETARLLGITRLLEKSTSSLSYGEKKLVAIASILSYDPEILLLDEPFSNLHPSKQEILARIVIDQARQGKTIVITSPGEPPINIKCERTAYIENGVLIKYS